MSSLNYFLKKPKEGSFGSIYAKWSFGDGTKEKKVEIRLGD